MNQIPANYSAQLRDQPLLQKMVRKLEDASHYADEALTKECKVVYRKILEEQRQWLIQKNHDEQILDEEIFRKHLLRIDMEEEKMRLM